MKSVFSASPSPPSSPGAAEGDSGGGCATSASAPRTLCLPVTADDRRIAWLAYLAIALALAENAIPSPLPGVKPGLANIVTLVVLERYGWRTAVWVALLRVVAASLLMGTFLAPAFFLSFAGALASLVVLGASRTLPQRWFGPVTHSVAAALAHMAGQLAVVWLWLIPHAGLALLVPVFALAALLFGTLNGLAAALLLRRFAVQVPQHPPLPRWERAWSKRAAP
jgi:heptaprenyl diphosphate synthase